jgi:hypothetical protein
MVLLCCITRHPLQGGVRGPRGSRELAEAGTSGCGMERRNVFLSPRTFSTHAGSCRSDVDARVRSSKRWNGSDYSRRWCPT